MRLPPRARRSRRPLCATRITSGFLGSAASGEELARPRRRCRRRFVVGTVDGCAALAIWSAASGERLATLPVCGGKGRRVVSAVSVSADGLRFAAAVAAVAGGDEIEEEPAPEPEAAAAPTAGRGGGGGGGGPFVPGLLLSPFSAFGRGGGRSRAPGAVSPGRPSPRRAPPDDGESPCLIVWELTLQPPPPASSGPAPAADGGSGSGGHADPPAAAAAGAGAAAPPPPPFSVERVLTIPLRAARHGPGGATACALSPDGGVLGSGGRDGAARAWAVPGGALLVELLLPPAPPPPGARQPAGRGGGGSSAAAASAAAASPPPPAPRGVQSLFPSEYAAKLALFASPASALPPPLSGLHPHSAPPADSATAAAPPPSAALAGAARSSPAALQAGPPSAPADVVAVAVSAAAADGSVLVAAATAAPQRLVPWDGADPRLHPREPPPPRPPAAAAAPARPSRRSWDGRPGGSALAGASGGPGAYTKWPEALPAAGAAGAPDPAPLDGGLFSGLAWGPGFPSGGGGGSSSSGLGAWPALAQPPGRARRGEAAAGGAVTAGWSREGWPPLPDAGYSPEGGRGGWNETFTRPLFGVAEEGDVSADESRSAHLRGGGWGGFDTPAPLGGGGAAWGGAWPTLWPSSTPSAPGAADWSDPGSPAAGWEDGQQGAPLLPAAAAQVAMTAPEDYGGAADAGTGEDDGDGDGPPAPVAPLLLSTMTTAPATTAFTSPLAFREPSSSFSAGGAIAEEDAAAAEAHGRRSPSSSISYAPSEEAEHSSAAGSAAAAAAVVGGGGGAGAHPSDY